jgi:O-antigen/teichoic acid export membrane protein
LSIKKNTIANYIGQGYRILIGIVILPLYLKYLGAEAYGLVGFFAVLQSWLSLLDMGMTPTLARQVAHMRGKSGEHMEIRRLLRSIELIFLILAFCAGGGVVLGSKWIALHWLKIEKIALIDVVYCISLMGVMVGMRWFSSLYQSGIKGMETQVRLNVANIIVATLRFVGGLLFICFVSRHVVDFFVFQLCVSIIEVVTMSAIFYRLLPASPRVGVAFFWSSLKPFLPFAISICFTTGVWILVTQTDKLLLSNILPLKEYGYFALVTVLANGILQISGPISQALLPRMTYLLSQGKKEAMIELYHKATQIMAVIMLPLTGMVAVFSTKLLYAWTGDITAAEWAGPILFWYVLGNGFLSMAAFQYYLQFAYGQLKLHVLMNTVFAIIAIPVIVFSAYHGGAMWTAIAWFGMQLVSFMVCPAIIHAKFAPGEHKRWLFSDIGVVAFPTIVLLIVFHALGEGFVSTSRFHIFGCLIGMGLFILTVNAWLSPTSRNMMMTLIRKALSSAA